MFKDSEIVKYSIKDKKVVYKVGNVGLYYTEAFCFSEDKKILIFLGVDGK